MTVRELIATLTAQPQDAEVVVNMRSNELGNGLTVGYVETVNGVRWKSDDGLSQWHEDYYPTPDEDDERQTIVNINSGRKYN